MLRGTAVAPLRRRCGSGGPRAAAAAAPARTPRVRGAHRCAAAADGGAPSAAPDGQQRQQQQQQQQQEEGQQQLPTAIEARLQQLQELQAASREALTARGAPPGGGGGGGGSGGPSRAAPGAYFRPTPSTVDARLYQQLVSSHNRLGQERREVEAHVDALKEEIARANAALSAAHAALSDVAREFGTTRRLAESASAALAFGVEPEEAKEKLRRLAARLARMEEAVEGERAAVGARVPRAVPLEWAGHANEVVLMGDWDGWTRGVDLSAEDVTSDAVFARFEGVLALRPGRYRVKLKVDGQWRLAADWPVELDDAGNEVNVLTVV
ncbi:hypothetical protein Rsub_07316 [Raphidocelis subcapitata]|uniref:AMP-activated protein kinase glycogen-binding domain-containing protein n=1 Tax=Raphidocelis subcapitata TaxID=307507 RepID=A0A2V0P2E4_9CHLO|nr:hypothetical protein Rsub_07316 [Raphidocelis subcapitata]|eukprot:GBF94048.1 hypothetical protein Rsub_07316 [Raphidocelis subcapitata]